VRARHVTYYTISETEERVLAGDRTLGLPRVKRTICQLSYENTKRQQTLAGFEPAPPKGTDFESVTLTTPSQRLEKKKRKCKSAALPLELTPHSLESAGIDPATCRTSFAWRLGASIPLPVECESTALPLELNPRKEKETRASSPGIEPGSQR
jgi:hypothetical protein